MKIMHVIIGLEASGAELFLQRLAQKQQGRYDDVLVVSLSSDGVLAEPLRALGVKVFALELKSITGFPGVILRLRRLIRTEAPDIIQSWMYHADFVTSIAVLGLKHRLIWSVRCTHVPAGSKITYAVMKLCAYLSNLIPKKICYVAESAMLNHHDKGYNKNKSIYIPNGYDFASFQFDENKRKHYRNLIKLTDDTLLVGAVGRFHQDKGQDLLFNAFKLQLTTLPNLKLLLVGRGCDSNNDALVTLLRKLALEDAVILVGEQTDVAGWLSAMDVYVMPSRTEGFPNALAEAMAVGLPCVATNVGDATILANRFALLCEPTVISITQMLGKMLAMSVESRTDIGNNAAVWVRKSFSISAIEQKYHQLYLQTLEF